MSSPQAPVRFALLGCGRIAPKHIEAIRNTPGARITAVCDIIPERAASKSLELDVPAYNSLDDLLAQAGTNIDVISVLTPSGLHAEHTIRAAQAGKHVLVEKPMALNLADADRMIEATEKARVELFVVKQMRTSPAVERLRRAVDEGRFGKLALGTVRVRWTRTQAYYDQDPWRGTFAMDGGVIANQAIHFIDLLQWMMGHVESVYAMTTTRLVNIEAEDTAVATLRFANGALGVIEATSAVRPQNLEGSLSVIGEGGTVVLGGIACNEVQTWSFTRAENTNGLQADPTENAPHVATHQPVIHNIVSTLRAGARPLVDGYEGRKSAAIVNAIYESAKRRVEVRVAEVRGR